MPPASHQFSNLLRGIVQCNDEAPRPGTLLSAEYGQLCFSLASCVLHRFPSSLLKLLHSLVGFDVSFIQILFSLLSS